jgi:hypothetical protein
LKEAEKKPFFLEKLKEDNQCEIFKKTGSLLQNVFIPSFCLFTFICFSSNNRCRT